MLTGKVGFRVNWRGRLILQVETTEDRSGYFGGSVESWTVKTWRDAKAADLLTLNNGYGAMKLQWEPNDA